MREREKKNLWSVTDIENGLSELIIERELEKNERACVKKQKETDKD